PPAHPHLPTSPTRRSSDLADTLMPHAEEAARKAVALDDSLAEAHLSLAATYLFFRWDWAAAERESARTLELNPNFAQGHHLHGRSEEHTSELQSRGHLVCR